MQMWLLLGHHEPFREEMCLFLQHILLIVVQILEHWNPIVEINDTDSKKKKIQGVNADLLQLKNKSKKPHIQNIFWIGKWIFM